MLKFFEKPIIWILLVLIVPAIVLANNAFSGTKESSKSSSTSQTTSQTDSSSTKTTDSSFDPQAFYKQTCIGCHGDQYQGVVGPTLKNLDKKYKLADVENILKNGKSGGMPSGLVKDQDIPKMANWVLSLK